MNKILSILAIFTMFLVGCAENPAGPPVLPPPPQNPDYKYLMNLKVTTTHYTQTQWQNEYDEVRIIWDQPLYDFEKYMIDIRVYLGSNSYPDPRLSCKKTIATPFERNYEFTVPTGTRNVKVKADVVAVLSSDTAVSGYVEKQYTF